MRILSLIDAMGWGGAEQVLVRLVTSLPEAEHAVIHCSRINDKKAHGPFIRSLRGAGANVADADWRIYADPHRLRDAMGGMEPDVVICHWWRGAPWLAWMRQLEQMPSHAPRPPFICVLHATLMDAPPGFDRYVILADAHRAQIPAGGRIHVIPNGVDTRRFRPSRRRTRSAEPTDRGLRIGRLARLDPGKTPADLVHLMDRWAVPGARWQLAGGGSLWTALAADALAVRATSDITLLGALPRQRIAPWLRSQDVVFHITPAEVAECHPLALLEALACGIPVVAERRGGVPEIVRDGIDGLLGDGPDEVGEHLRRLSTDRALLARLRAGAREAAPRLDVGHQVAAWRALLAEVAPDRPMVRPDGR